MKQGPWPPRPHGRNSGRHEARSLLGRRRPLLFVLDAAARSCSSPSPSAALLRRSSSTPSHLHASQHERTPKMSVTKVKAQWDREATRIFCECAAAQVEAGRRPTKYLTPAGYKGLMKEFNGKTGRNYEKKQFKNHWDDMKSIYCAWVFYKNKVTGLGWDDVTQTVTVDDAQWDAMIKVHKAIRAFRKGPPDNVKQLLMMFGGANVDGLSSVMPRVDDDEEEEEEEEQTQVEPPVETEQEVIELYEEENEPPAPVQPKPKRKKASAIPCSPSKSKKNNVPKDLKRFVDHVIQEDRAGQTSKNTDNDDILAIMEEVAKCGVSETSDEYYIATKLFAKPSNRSFFYAMKTTEGRVNWLKRQFEDKK